MQAKLPTLRLTWEVGSANIPDMSEPYPVSMLIEKTGAARIAKAAGVNRTTPYSWKNGVPPLHAVRVAAAVGLQPHELRPDVFPPPSQAAE